MAAGRRRCRFRAGADRAAIEGALEAELPRVASDLVAENADVLDDWLHAGRDVLDIAERAIELQVEGLVVQQSAECALAVVERVAECDKLLEKLVDVGQAAVDVIDELRAALA